MERYKVINIRKKEDFKLLSKYIQAVKEGNDFYEPTELGVAEMSLQDIRTKYKLAYAKKAEGAKNEF